MTIQEQFLSPRQAAERLGLQTVTIYRWIKVGRIKAQRLLNGQLRIESLQIEKFLKQ